MYNEHIYHATENPYKLFPFVLLIIMYILASLFTRHRSKPKVLYRTLFWILGILCMTAVLIGPLADQAHTDFPAHMFGHLLLGMLAPLLIVLSAPMTLVLRSLSVKQARRLSCVLKSAPIRVPSNPIVASLLNVGGLWILYSTNLYSAMHKIDLLYLFVHIHIFIAGYLFASTMIYIDPTPHRTSFIYRSIVLVLASASHGILAKYIYANPPLHVPTAQARKGAILMYYGGDAIDIILIFILCLQWYRSSKSKEFVNNQAIL
jgi:putative membrane protein